MALGTDLVSAHGKSSLQSFGIGIIVDIDPDAVGGDPQEFIGRTLGIDLVAAHGKSSFDAFPGGILVNIETDRVGCYPHVLLGYAFVSLITTYCETTLHSLGGFGGIGIGIHAIFIDGKHRIPVAAQYLEQRFPRSGLPWLDA